MTQFRIPRSLVWALALATALAAAPMLAEEPAREGRRPFSDAEYWAQRWDDPERKDWQKPLEVLDLLGIQPGDTVADLGAGTGYFSILLAIVAGETGTVYAVDVEPELLEHIRNRTEPTAERITTVLATPGDPKLPDDAVDVILTVNTWHHIDDRVTYLDKLARALNRWGRMVVVDYRKGELPLGPPPEHKLSRDQVVSEFAEAGWTLEAESVALPYQYALVFHPPRAAKPVADPS